MLETDRAQAYALDDVQLAVAISRSKAPALYMISEEAFSKAEPFGIMLRPGGRAVQGARRPRHRGALRSPEIEVMYRRWLEAPTPPKGINATLDVARAAQRVRSSSSSLIRYVNTCMRLQIVRVAMLRQLHNPENPAGAHQAFTPARPYLRARPTVVEI